MTLLPPDENWKEEEALPSIDIVLDNAMYTVLFLDLPGPEGVKKAMWLVDYFMKEFAVEKVFDIHEFRKWCLETHGQRTYYKLNGKMLKDWDQN